MSYCIKCNVEVDPFIEKCPLCQSDIQKTNNVDEILAEKRYPEKIIEEDETVEDEDQKKRSRKRKRFVALEVVSVSAVVPFIIVLGINMFIERSFTITIWGMYASTSIVLAWILISVPLLFLKRPLLIVVGETLSLIAFLVLIDFYNGWTLTWSYRLALPIIGITALATSIVVLMSIKSKNKGINIAAFVLFGVSVICLGLDLIISSYSHETITVKWSFYVIVPLMLIGGFLLYLYYRLTRIIDLKRVLEIRKKLKT